MTEEEGRHDRDEGMDQALNREDIQPWKYQFQDTVLRLPPGTPLTSEDIIEIVGLPSGEVVLHGNNAVGAVMAALAKQGAIVKAGRHVPSRRRPSHSAELTLWFRAGTPKESDAE